MKSFIALLLVVALTTKSINAQGNLEDLINSVFTTPPTNGNGGLQTGTGGGPPVAVTPAPGPPTTELPPGVPQTDVSFIII